MLVQVHLDNPIVGLVGDQYVRIWKPRALNGGVEQVGTRPRLTKLPVLPDDVAVLVDQEHPVIWSAIGSLGYHTGGRAGTGHQRKSSNPLGVIATND